MKTTLPSNKSSGIARARTVTTVDPAAIDDTSFPPADVVACKGWQRAMVFPRFQGGKAASVTLQVLVRAGSAEGGSWAFQGAKFGPLADGQMVTVDVGGRDVFFRVTALTGDPKSVELFVGGWEKTDRSDAAL